MKTKQFQTPQQSFEANKNNIEYFLALTVKNAQKPDLTLCPYMLIEIKYFYIYINNSIYNEEVEK